MVRFSSPKVVGGGGEWWGGGMVLDLEYHLHIHGKTFENCMVLEMDHYTGLLHMSFFLV